LQGKDYCQVKDRIFAFNEQNQKGSIQTTSQFVGELVIMKATIYPNIVDEPTRFFTASSFGQVKGIKAFEKLESVAVGRALAYLGFGIDGSIASYEEMENFVNSTDKVEAKTVSQEAPKKDNSKDDVIFLTGEQYQIAKEFTIEQLTELLNRKEKDGKQFKMKKEFRENLTQILNEKQAKTVEAYNTVTADLEFEQ
jgi:hypothetical protein